jgi:hypothetical protein
MSGANSSLEAVHTTLGFPLVIPAYLCPKLRTAPNSELSQAPNSELSVLRLRTKEFVELFQRRGREFGHREILFDVRDGFHAD